MLNAEKFKKEILENSNVVFDFSVSKEKHKIKKCLRVCENCIFYDMGDHCSNAKVKWLLSEYKEPIKLSKLEYDILKYMSDNTAYLYIARDKSGFLGVYRSEPDRLNTSWCCYNSTDHLNVFAELFQFIKWEEEKPRVIRDILENCVVKEIKEDE